ncbi:MAG: hypothetical protein ACRDLB_02355 [Actinomycetota bacterium]
MAGNADAIDSFDWSPDSKHIVYFAFERDDQDYDLRLATRGERRTVPLEECDMDHCDTDLDVWIADVAEGTARNVTNQRGSNDTSPQWSPNGRRLVLLRWAGSSSRTDLYSMRRNGWDMKRLRTSPGPESLIDW